MLLPGEIRMALCLILATQRHDHHTRGQKNKSDRAFLGFCFDLATLMLNLNYFNGTAYGSMDKAAEF